MSVAHLRQGSPARSQLNLGGGRHRSRLALATSLLKGFDVSHWNAQADFSWAKRIGGESFAYLKATQGSNYTDPTFAERKAAAKAAGVPAGAYLFLEPDQPAADQVARFVDVVGLDMPLRVALDHETESANGPASCAATARAVIALLERHYGYAPVLYSYPSFIGAGNCAGLGAYPLWIASYNGQSAPSLGGDVWHDWAIWQTGQASVPGVSGGDGPGVDVNVTRSLSAILAPTSVPTPSPAPTPMPTTQGEPVQIIRATGRSAATLDSAGLAHPVSSAKWSALVHAGQKGLTVEIATLSADDYDACIPAAATSEKGGVYRTGQHAEAVADAYVGGHPMIYNHLECDGIAVPDGKIGA